MSDDDDEDCGHVWVLEELDKLPPEPGRKFPRVVKVSSCPLCGAIRYEVPLDDRGRPPPA